MTEKTKHIRMKYVLRIGLCLAMIAAMVLIGAVMASAEDVKYSEGLAFKSNKDGTCKVTGIGTCTDTVINIPPVSPSGETVTQIANSAFKSASNIVCVFIPEKVEIIGKYAFGECSKLESVILHDGLLTIGDYAFIGCYKIKTISIPKSVTSIGSNAFSICADLTSITFAEGSNLIRIGESAFENCRSLKSISIPEGVIEIGNKAFKNCYKLESVDLPGSMTTINQDMFLGCNSIINIIIPEGVVNIGGGAFAGCSGAKTVFLPKSLECIGYHAFEACSGLINIIIPENVTTIEYGAFYECTSLINVILPDGLVNLGNSVFSGCSNLADITLPSQLTTIPNGLFGGCSSLQKIDIPDSVKTISDNAFLRCSSLTSIVIPEGVTSIGNYAFSNCSNMNKVVLPSSITSLGGYCFEACWNLKDIKIPSGLSAIYSYTFSICSGLQSVVIPEGINKIGYCAFYSCSRLTSITIPKSVTSIDYGAFYVCSKLSDVYYYGTEEEWKSITIGMNNDPLLNATIHYLGEPVTPTYSFDASSNRWVDEDGNPAEGFVQLSDGQRYYCEDGVKMPYYGLIKHEDSYYYINDYARPFAGGEKYITRTNGLTLPDGTPIAQGFYTFDEDGKMLVGIKNGFVDGVYYENNLPVSYAGLIKHEGSYYYINDNARPFAGGEKYITRTNGLTLPDGTPIPQGMYTFDEDGRMSVSVKNGLVDGIYYENNLAVSYAGLICQDGNYYYINDDAKPVAARRYYITNTHGYLPAGWYEFDENGVLILPAA